MTTTTTMTIPEMKAKRIELNQIVKAREAALAAEMGLTDDSTDREWDMLTERLANMPERIERTSLTVEIERIEAVEIQAAIAAHKSAQLQMCPKHHLPLTLGRCDECDDWDN